MNPLAPAPAPSFKLLPTGHPGTGKPAPDAPPTAAAQSEALPADAMLPEALPPAPVPDGQAPVAEAPDREIPDGPALPGDEQLRVPRRGYSFNGTMPRDVLESYLSRAVSMANMADDVLGAGLDLGTAATPGDLAAAAYRTTTARVAGTPPAGTRRRA